MRCSLCGSAEARHCLEADGRQYFECVRCRLIFVPSRFWPTPEEEHARYDQHRNSPDDLGYREFLSRPCRAVRDRVPPPATGLDFGSGPGPTLSLMLAGAGYDMRVYDVFYAPDESVLEGPYDFVTCTEVIEHLHDPATVLSGVVERLRPGGWLVVQTQLAPGHEAFATWRYRRDQTHVGFYSETTFRHLARMLDCRLERAADDVFAFQPAPA